ncbi:radical SAM/SPASM domain-containing protein [Paenibacillus sp. 1-18]|uniref:radical SAM/SPASM domain-containing protein n=1 Tax=Paenibacillus sp. 1-18 TaxID=1333846 RepID=UPI000472A45B|nr:radical SAM protein [Paenibacillus sp. 1-18]
MLDRVLIPTRLSLIYRNGVSLGYNPGLNLWERLDDDTAEVLRWLRAGRSRNDIREHLERRFDYIPALALNRLEEILKWCVLRRLLYLDREPQIPELVHSDNSLKTVYWVCTQACNLRCTYCYQVASMARPHELTTSEAIDLVDQVVETGATTLIFTGGEPMTRRDLLDIARYARSRGLRTNIISNGHYITPKNINKIASIFNEVTISLDHGLAEHHDHHRGKGSWQRVVHAIDLLINAGVNVNINSVLSQLGLRDVKELLSFARNRQLGVHRIIPQFPMGRGGCNRNSELSPSELMSLNDQLYRANQELTSESDTQIQTEGSYSRKKSRRNHCGAGLSEISIDPEGWVFPCKLLQYSEFKTDNIRDRRLAEIFQNHPSFKVIQSKVVDKLSSCKTCIIKNHCGGGCRGIHYSFTEKYIQSDQMFCAYLRSTFEHQTWSSTGDIPSARKVHFYD